MVGDSGERGSIHDFGDLNIEVVGTPGGVIHSSVQSTGTQF